MRAGKRRFRPILLTSMTTIAGLFPMLLEKSLQAQVLIPMAVSLIFGLLTGTLLILILVPVFYHIYGTILQNLGIRFIAMMTMMMAMTEVELFINHPLVAMRLK